MSAKIIKLGQRREAVLASERLISEIEGAVDEDVFRRTGRNAPTEIAIARLRGELTRSSKASRHIARSTADP